MTESSPEGRFRQAAEAEGGTPVSAGARVVHARLAVEAGRAFYVDLSRIPEDRRSAVVAEIKELVNRASTGSSATSPSPAADGSNASG